MELKTQSFCDEQVQVLVIRNLNVPSEQNKVTLDSDFISKWSNMLGQLFEAPAQEVIRLANLHRQRDEKT